MAADDTNSPPTETETPQIPTPTVKIVAVDRSKRETQYIIEFETNLRQYTKCPYQDVRREYAEFARLYEHLVVTYPGCITPTLPLPRSSAADTEANDREVSRALEQFLLRTAQHTALCRDVLLQRFIEDAEPFEPAVTVKELEHRSQYSLLRNLRARVAALSTSANPASTINGAASAAMRDKTRADTQDANYDRIQSGIGQTEKHMSAGSQSVEVMCRSRHGLVAAQVDMASKVVHLSGSETDPLLANGMRKLGRCMQQVSDLYQQQADEEATLLGDFLNYQMHDAHCVNKVLENRKRLFADHSAAAYRVEKRKQTLKQLKSSAGIRQERVNDALAELEEAERYEKYMAQQCARVNKQLRGELKSHQQQMCQDTQQRFHNFALEQLRMERLLLNTLHDLEPDVKAMFDAPGRATQHSV